MQYARGRTLTSNGAVMIPKRFYYFSSNGDWEKPLQDDLVERIREYLIAKGFSRSTTKGELQDTLLAYTEPDGSRLMVNQLQPIFLYLARYGQIWEKFENDNIV